MSERAPICTLPEAIAGAVHAGMHLHFASTPSRSNASIIEVARQFQQLDPQFVLSATGFHSVAHLLAILRLGRRYIASFFGDNYPSPRPNPLYSTLRREGAALEVWSLGTLVTALRAGAMGLPFAVTRSLVGSTLGEDLAAQGRLRWAPDEDAALIAPMRPDVAFVHALVGDAQGNVLFSGPTCEGFWGALGAKEGVIVTVESLVAPEVVRQLPGAIAIPRHRIRAICLAPGGAHPQPVPALPVLNQLGYADDLHHYALWRELGRDPELFARFAETVLDAEDGQRGYRAFVDAHRPVRAPAPVAPRRPHRDPALARLVLAARWIAQRVREEGYPVILAGIGQSFLASRMAAQTLAAEGIEVSIMVETGLYDVDCARSHPFLLSYDNLNAAQRHSDVEDILLTLTCGADSRCLGVVGAGQVDPDGNINSTLIAPDRFLVGSGGANDIASCAAEVIALSPCRPDRLVAEVDHITSPGRRLRSVVTERGVLVRSDARLTSWRATSLYPLTEDLTPALAIALIRQGCAWPDIRPSSSALTSPLSAAEWTLIRQLDPTGSHWNRTEKTWSPSRSQASAATSHGG